MMRAAGPIVMAGVLAMLAFRVGLGAQEAPLAENRVVPVYEEPRHRQVFTSGTTRILELLVLPGDTSLFHSHTDPVLYVNLASGALRTQELGKDWSQPGRGGRAGGPAQAAPATPAVRVSSTTSYVERPVTHRIMNTGASTVHALVVVNQTAGSEATTERDAGFDGMPEMANKWYRAYRFSLAPGQAVMHRHTTPAVLAQTADGSATAQGARLWALNDTGAWAFFAADDRHEIRNTGSAPVELVEIEVRQPAR